MIDISHSVTVSDFAAVRRSGILGVIHKATEGGDWIDPSYAVRQPQAERPACCGAPIISARASIPAPSRRSCSCRSCGPRPRR